MVVLWSPLSFVGPTESTYNNKVEHPQTVVMGYNIKTAIKTHLFTALTPFPHTGHFAVAQHEHHGSNKWKPWNSAIKYSSLVDRFKIPRVIHKHNNMLLTF